MGIAGAVKPIYFCLSEFCLNKHKHNMNLPKHPILFFLLFTSSFLAAQNAHVEGQVFMAGQATPIPAAYVYIDGTDIGTVTDGRGSFILKNIPAGGHDLVATCVGFASLVQPIVLSEGENKSLRLEMHESVMGLPEAVVSAVSLTGGRRGLRDLPGSAHYISPLEIEKFSYTDIGRTLRAVPGVNLQEEDGFGLRPNIGLRGTGSERSSKITVMEDGVLAAPAPYSAPAAYYFPTIGRMQAVEILKGSSQIRFGPYTTGGAINLLSTAIPESFSGRIHLLGGSFGNRNLHVHAGNSHRNLAYLVEAFQYHSEGFKDLPNGGGTGFDKKDYLAKFRLHTGPSAKIYQSLTFKTGQSNETSDETYLGLTQADFEATPNRRYAASQMDEMNAGHEQYALRHLVQFSEKLDLVTTVYRNDFHRNWYKLDKVVSASGEKTKIAELLENPENFAEGYGILTGETSVGEAALQVKANNRDYRSEGIQTVLGHRFTTGKLRHSLGLGFRFHTDEVDRFQWVDGYKMDNGRMELTRPGRPGTESNRIESATAAATYLQYKLKVGAWTFVPGLRHEHIKLERRDFGKNDPERLGTGLSERGNKVDVWIPGIGADYKFSEQFSLFGGVHRGFSPPGNKAGTEPEKSINYELGSRWQTPLFSGQAVLFFNDYDNLLGTDLAAAGGTGSADLFNGGEVRTLGLELQMGHDLLAAKNNGWSMPISFTYTLTDAKFQSGFESDFEGWGTVEKGDRLPYLAKNQFTILWNLNHKKYNFNLSARYQSAMRTVAGQGDIPEMESTGSYFVVDANASYLLHPKLSVFGSLTNLTNDIYVVARRPAGLRPGMPRAFMGGMKVDF